MKTKIKQKAYVVSVDMGYGHQRAAYPLRDLATSRQIINANSYRGIPAKDRQIWHQGRALYEFVSRFKQVPAVGQLAFAVFDRFQEIPKFYPKRDLSKTNVQLLDTIHRIKTRRWGFHLISKLEKKPLPLLATCFAPACMAEIYNYNQEIYLAICDADVSRTWVMPDARQSRINYFAPCQRVVDRLKLYGVKEEKIFLTGFPLPKENLGGTKLTILKEDFAKRLCNLDPQNTYLAKYRKTIIDQLGHKKLPKSAGRPLTLTFAVGGAGAQRELGLTIVQSLAQEIAKGQLRINLVAGIHNDVNHYFNQGIQELRLGKHIGREIKIIFAQNKNDYFKV